ncbi:uncharacterized protein ZBAI_04008 [Zygosaccharomyces bailii ISA1307]|nr:uncharacterized protein ZBAI_04008 [Zygosaccharomyces bailii ISA1307]
MLVFCVKSVVSARMLLGGCETQGAKRRPSALRAGCSALRAAVHSDCVMYPVITMVVLTARRGSRCSLHIIHANRDRANHPPACLLVTLRFHVALPPSYNYLKSPR